MHGEKNFKSLSALAIAKEATVACMSTRQWFRAGVLVPIASHLQQAIYNTCLLDSKAVAKGLKNTRRA